MSINLHPFVGEKKYLLFGNRIVEKSNSKQLFKIF